MRSFHDKNELSLLIRTSWLRRAGVILVVAPALLLAACKAEQHAAEESVRPVKVAVVGAPATERVLTYSGVVRPRIESAVGFRVSGKIVERLVNAGERVEVGTVIARLDDTDLRHAETSARAAVAAARTRRDVARQHFERAAPLLPQGFISKAAYDARRNELDAAAAALESAEAQVRQAANAVDYATLRADKAGLVTAVTAEPGQVVSAGMPVLSLAEAGEIEIALAVPEHEAGHLVIGGPVKVSLWAGPRQSLEGRIREVAAQADAASRTYAVRVAVSNPPPAMRLGMTASVALRVNDGAASITVPLTALTEGDGRPVVFVVDPESGTVRTLPVTIESTASDGIKVGSGLRPGDIIVTAGVQFLRDGMRVRLPAEAARPRVTNSAQAVIR